MSKKQVIDERFKRITYDPSFKSMKKDEKKIKIDKRFAGVLNDPKFKLVSKTDKYGNPIEIEEGLNKEMEEMYYQEDQQEESKEEVEKDQEKRKEKKDKKKDKKNDDDSKEKKDKKKQKKAAPKEESEEVEAEEEEENEHDRSFSWHEVSSSDEELEFGDEDGIENEEQFHYGVTNEKAPLSEDSSSKLALLNYDWMNITAADILLLFNSFKDKNAVIHKVTVYPSEYGLTMLQKEIEEGPNNIWKYEENQKKSGNQAGEGEEENDDDSDHDQPSKKKDKKSMKQQEEDKKKEQSGQNKKNSKSHNNEEDDGKEKGEVQNQKLKLKKKEYKAKSLFESRKANFLNHTVVARVGDDQCDIDPVKLREYERQRMRYYYAVIECDSKSTADKIYTQCDGMEFEMSGIPIDLRFVPEEQVFPYEPKEVCDEVPADSQVKNISNRSVGHTNAKLTWDQPQDRFKFMDGKMTEKDYAKIDWSKYIAPCEDNNEDELNENIEDEDESNEDLGSDDEIAKLEKEALRQQQEIDNLNWRKQFDKKGRKKQSDGQIEITFNQGFDDLGNRILERQKAKDETIFETRDRQRQEKRSLRKQEIKEKINKNKKNKLNATGATDNSEDAADKKRQKEYLELLIDKEDNPTEKDKEIALDDPRFKAIYETNDYSIDPNSKFFNKQTSSRMLQEQITRRKKQKLNQD